ncbi:MAG: nickel pincer cofactor biosynthesis protein LarB [Gemmatimonadota bacterium]
MGSHFRADEGRAERLGFDEAILCEPKTESQVHSIVDDAQQRGASLLLTRLEADRAGRLAAVFGEQLDYDELSRTAYFGDVAAPEGHERVVVVSGGTSDIAVCREAVRTLYYYGVRATELYDVGVAGLSRLLDRIDHIRGYPVAIAVAGMDAALPTVLAGLIPAFVVAVPTSTGYGTAEGGRTALKAVLSSCAPGLVSVNIDNGYGAACAALRVLGAGASPRPDAG